MERQRLLAFEDSSAPKGFVPARSERLQKLLTAQDLAESFQVSRRQIYVWIDQGILPHHRCGTRLLRFTAEDVDEFLRRSAEEAP